jgi:hypothetical protein
MTLPGLFASACCSRRYNDPLDAIEPIIVSKIKRLSARWWSEKTHQVECTGSILMMNHIVSGESFSDPYINIRRRYISKGAGI